MTIVLSVLFRLTASDYPFDILDLRLLITHLISSIFSFTVILLINVNSTMELFNADRDN